MHLLAFNVIGSLEVALLLLVIGGALLVAEVFFPSGGVLGFLSATALLAAIWFAFQHGGTSFAVGFTLAEVAAAPVLIYFAFKYMPYTPFGKKLLGDAPSAEDVAVDDQRNALVGKVGVARSKMLPSGAVEIDGEMIDAVSRGQPIEPGQYVKVVEVRGNRVMVSAAPTGQRPGDGDPSDLLTRPVDELGFDGDPLA